MFSICTFNSRRANWHGKYCDLDPQIMGTRRQVKCYLAFLHPFDNLPKAVIREFTENDG